MPLVKVSEILKEADKGGYAVTAFDTFNFETINWVIEAGSGAEDSDNHYDLP